MIIKKEEYDELNSRTVALSKALKESDIKSEELKKIIEEILYISTRNNYGNAEINLRKIKEVILSNQKLKITPIIR